MNSLFFDYPCKGDGRDERGAVSTDLAWCKSENILACALDSGRVAIYQDEASSILQESKQHSLNLVRLDETASQQSRQFVSYREPHCQPKCFGI